ncbi:ComEA family DNA-binding protein [Modestobacter sp. VKM Ac-2978]|uniref:ComEA family DNA-binding protein n=1 Tax=Modestobacter sp. VKM Ac-2978 TaxID=3004132 RepID=UPI0022AA71AC|nr:ComEA family DNA-binding protein [Modestobacter sp. VKM Ac-2978]MCZ2847353.1 ComEA family DNA-binding protein [Modestobacter sp. VKM Ac-2978]
MRPPARRSDDSDVIRARLRALLAEGQSGGWVPDADEPGGPSDDGGWPEDEDDRATQPVEPAHLPAGLGRHRAPGRAARLDPGRPGAWALWGVAVLAAVVVVGWTWVDRPVVDQVPAAASSGAAVATASPVPPASAAPAPGVPTGTVVVSVVGLVGTPGLVTLPAGARVADALAAAGGLLPEADPASVNAAAVVSDGQQIAVGVPGAVAGAEPAGGAAAGGALVDLNTATVAELDALPGIGPVLAQRIVDHRSAHGPFTSVDRLDDVSGIGPAIFADLAERVRV